MNYPLISEYIEAIRFAEDNFDKLSNLRPVLDNNGNPVMSSGNFAVVFKMKDIKTDKLYAVKCFTRDQEERAERYREIIKVLDEIKSPYFVSTQYYDKELFVDTSQDEEKEFPVLVMDWVEGMPLDRYIQQYKGNSFVLHEICYKFRLLAKWLLSQNFAHGDIKPDNIIVRADGSVVLIDYDGMFVQNLQNNTRKEFGSPNFIHPYKTPSYDTHIDDFALAVTALALKLMSVSFGIIDAYGVNDGLLFRELDFKDLKSSRLIDLICSLIISDNILGLYYSTFIKSYSGNTLKPEDFDFIQEKDIDELLHFWSPNVFISEDTKKSIGVCSENGVIYNKDGDSVIGFVYSEEHPEEIHIKEGTICICENAFEYSIKSKLRLHLPSTIRYFNSKSFNYRYCSLSWDSPWFVYSSGYIMTQDRTEAVLKHLAHAKLDNSVHIIGQHLFDGLEFDDSWPETIFKIRHSAFSDARLSESFTLPDEVAAIGDFAFKNSSLKRIVLPYSLYYIGKYCFHLCEQLQSIDFSKCTISEVPKGCCCNCKQLVDIHFSEFTKIIGDSAFIWCESIETLAFPDSLEEILDDAFHIYSPSKLKNIDFPKNLKCIHSRSFYGLMNLMSISFSSDVDVIGDEAFMNCNELEIINYKTIGRIGRASFAGCKLKLTITKGVKKIAVGALNGCTIISNKSDRYIIKDNSLYTKQFEELIYCWSNNNVIELPEGIRHIDKLAFLNMPKIIVLPLSFDKKHIKDALFCDVIVVPKYFQLENHFNNTVLTHEKVIVDDFGVIYTKDKHVLVKYPMSLPHKHYSVAQECIKIGDHAFEGDVEFDPEFGPFYNGNTLEELLLPETLECIGKRALQGCRKLKLLYLPDSLNELADFALEGCHSIKTICLPPSLIKIGTNALPTNLTCVTSHSDKFHSFGDCLLSKNNEIVWISSEIKELDLPRFVVYKGKECISYQNCIVSFEGELLFTIPDIEFFEFPNGVRIISDGAFCHNKVIKQLIIPHGVVSIENGAFSCNQGLKAIYLPKTIKQIGCLHTFQGWGRKYIEFYYPKEVHIPRGMKAAFKSMMPDIPESKLIDDIY